jgi:hypothetical protein
MGTSVVYEGEGFIRRGPPAGKSVVRPDVRAKAPAEESLEQVENRARALRRQYLNDFFCWLLERIERRGSN